MSQTWRTFFIRTWEVCVKSWKKSLVYQSLSQKYQICLRIANFWDDWSKENLILSPSEVSFRLYRKSYQIQIAMQIEKNISFIGLVSNDGFEGNDSPEL